MTLPPALLVAWKEHWNTLCGTVVLTRGNPADMFLALQDADYSRQPVVYFVFPAGSSRGAGLTFLALLRYLAETGLDNRP